jgi:hypothetical protein
VRNAQNNFWFGCCIAYRQSLTNLDKNIGESAMQRLRSSAQHADQQSPHQTKASFLPATKYGANHAGDMGKRIASTKACKSVKRLHNVAKRTMFVNKDSAVNFILKHM